MMKWRRLMIAFPALPIHAENSTPTSGEYGSRALSVLQSGAVLTVNFGADTYPFFFTSLTLVNSMPSARSLV